MSTIREPITCINGHEYTIPMWSECPKCQGERNARLGSRMNDEMRRLREAMATGRDKDAYLSTKQLRELGHPDVGELVRTITEKLKAKPKTAGRV